MFDALEILFEPDELVAERERLRGLLEVKSRLWADVLCGEDDRAAASLAIRLVSALPSDEPFNPHPRGGAHRSDRRSRGALGTRA